MHRSEKSASSGLRGCLPFLIIFFLAFIFRLVHLFQIKSGPFFDHLMVDAGGYDIWARKIAGGMWIGDGVFFQDPLYPYFLGIIYFIFGHDLFLARFLQIIIGSATAVLTALLGARVFNRSAGLIAGFLVAVYGVFIYYDAILIKSFLAAFLFPAAFLALLWAKEKQTRLYWFLPGLLLGLTVLVRANVILFLPVALGWLVWSCSRQGTLKQTSLSALVFVLGISVAILPVTARNALVGQDFVLTTYQGGQNFYIGNNPSNNTGRYMAPSFAEGNPLSEARDFWREAEKRTGHALKPSEVSSFWYTEAFGFVKSRPGNFIKLLGRKIILFLNYYELPDNQNFYFFKRYSDILRLPLPDFRIIGPLGLTGLLLFWRRNSATLLMGLLFLVFFVSTVPFFIFARYRLGVIPFLIIFGAAYLHWLFGKMRNRTWKPVILSMILFLPLCLAVNYPVTIENFGSACFNLAQVYESEGELDRAVETYQQALELSPHLRDGHVFLGQAYSRQKRFAEAEAEYRKALEIHPDSPRAWLNLGILEARKGNHEEAVSLFEKAISCKPFYAPAWYNLGFTAENMRNTEQAIVCYRKAMEYDPSYTKAYYNLGVLYLRTGEAGKAVEVLRDLLRIDPGSEKAEKALAVALSRAGHL